MSQGEAGDDVFDVEGSAQRVLVAFRTVASDRLRRLEWLSRSLLLHMMAREAAAAATLVVVKTDAPSGRDLRMLADELARLDPFKRLSLASTLMAHAAPYLGIPLGVAVLAIQLGGKVTAFPGTYGTVAGTVFFVCIALFASWHSFWWSLGHVRPAYEILEDNLDP